MSREAVLRPHRPQARTGSMNLAPTMHCPEHMDRRDRDIVTGPATSVHLRDMPLDRRTTESFPELRERIRALCARFPSSYWRDLDRRRAYPEAFVQAMTAEGFLGALIPAEYGGWGMSLAEASVILEEVNRSGGNAG